MFSYKVQINYIYEQATIRSKQETNQVLSFPIQEYKHKTRLQKEDIDMADKNGKGNWMC